MADKPDAKGRPLKPVPFCTAEGETKNGKRTTGFMRPLNVWQLLSWVVFLVYVIGFYSFMLPAVGSGARLGLGVAYGIVFVCVIYCWWFNTSVDPRDDRCTPDLPHTHRGETSDQLTARK
jgi:hypothetical protein